MQKNCFNYLHNNSKKSATQSFNISILRNLFMNQFQLLHFVGGVFSHSFSCDCLQFVIFHSYKFTSFFQAFSLTLSLSQLIHIILLVYYYYWLFNFVDIFYLVQCASSSICICSMHKRYIHPLESAHSHILGCINAQYEFMLLLLLFLLKWLKVECVPIYLLCQFSTNLVHSAAESPLKQ